MSLANHEEGCSMRSSVLLGVTIALGAMVASGGPLAGTAKAASATGTIAVQWNTALYSSHFASGGFGGEFQVTALTDPSNALLLQDVSRRAGGNFFQTFCGQLSEDIINGVTYNWSCETAFGDGQPLAPGTA